MNLNAAAEFAISALLVIGGSFCFIGALGLLRFRDFYMRLHAPTKASTLGVGGLLLASMGWHWAQGEWAVRELLITLFLFVTAPVSANLIALAALHLRVRSQAPVPAELETPATPSKPVTPTTPR